MRLSLLGKVGITVAAVLLAPEMSLAVPIAGTNIDYGTDFFTTTN